jgi:hypothetical protein
VPENPLAREFDAIEFLGFRFRGDQKQAARVGSTVRSEGGGSFDRKFEGDGTALGLHEKVVDPEQVLDAVLGIKAEGTRIRGHIGAAGGADAGEVGRGHSEHADLFAAAFDDGRFRQLGVGRRGADAGVVLVRVGAKAPMLRMALV